MPAVLSPPSPSRLRVPLAVAVAFLLQLAFAAALAAQAQGGSWSSVGNPPIPRSLERSPEFEWRRLRALRPLDLATSAAPGLALRETSQVLVPGIPVPLYGTDHVAAGVGLRNQARGVIALTGTPPGATLQAGFLYWGILGTIDPATAAGLYNKALLSGRSVVGQLIGWTLEPCWLGSGYFYAFRADVTDKLPPAINGNYTLELLLPASTVKDGRGSWQDPPAALVPPLADGASLVAIFSHPSLPSAARVYLHEGPVLVVGPVTLSHVLQPPLPAATFLRHTRLGADGQSQTGGAPTLPVVTSLGRLLTSVADLTVIRGPGSKIDPTPDWQGTDAGSSTQLWDTQTLDLPRAKTNLQPGDPSYEVDYTPVQFEPPYEPVEPLEPYAGDPQPPAPLPGYPALWPAPQPGFHNFDCTVVVADVLSVR